MGESGREGQEASAEAGKMLEGELAGPEIAAGAAQRDRVQAFHGQAKSLTSLDLLVELDEPEEVILELKRLAEARPRDDKRWEGIRRLCERAIEYFQVIHQPKPNRPQP